ncbi:uncharacterized protein V6R79_026365 [Siganus canaliculatus]
MAARLSRGVMWRLLPGPSAAAWSSSRAVGSVSSAPGPLSTAKEKPRTFEDLPRVSLLEMAYRMTLQGFHSRMHELQIYEKQLYGPVYRDAMNTVCINTPKLLEEVLRNDDKFPTRGEMSMWVEYRGMRGYGHGLLTENGQKWHNLRTVLNKRMLHPRDSVQYGDTINDVVTDFIRRMCYLRESSPTGDLVSNVGNEFYHFSLEAIASILLETRLGCLEKEIPTGTQEFIDAISKMFSANFIVFLMPKWSRNLLPHWERFVAGWDGIFNFATKLIDKKLSIIQQRLEDEQQVEGEYLTYLLSNTKMDIKDVYGSVTELLLAGVDTTSNTLTWTLHLLSRNPQSQARLYEEVASCVAADQIPSAEEVTQMPYLKAVIKESLRMYPVVPLNARIVTNKDVNIGGYNFSKNTQFTLCNYAISHDEDTFPDSFAFKPERWLRENQDRPNAFGSIPFGFGVRSCVGRRIAELEMYLALFRFISQFEVRPDPTLGELKSINRTVLVPDKPLSLHLLDRGGDNAA